MTKLDQLNFLVHEILYTSLQDFMYKKDSVGQV